MGQSMKEAMCCGRAVVGARIGGVPEAINDGYNGLLFEPDDPVDLARALKRLAKDAPLRNELGQNGRRLAEQKFSAEVAAQQTLEVFEMLLAKPAVK
jgi:glycosyltransferase involved in cell wall biosynthesis